MVASITGGTGIGGVRSCRLVDLEQHKDERGSLSVVESERTVGFSVRRVYYLHDLQPGTSRGGHAHRSLEQLIIAAHGAFTITVDDGFHRASHQLLQPGVGMYVGPMVWRNLSDFTEGAVCLVLASCHYDESDYYRDYDAFLRDTRGTS
ncbi:FdtA/QdtA family cupin domain-containing protein [Nocardiopsis sp. EMB25]|uniref:sugar 3,4-ketoisomerase n=1 Tax=Nocardiopsis TaxID=2013 RepID=UPI00034B0855|nr:MULTISPECIES: FdtA/QdtA family cupin domain-containing protein [Nocardiopsis]MCY9787306.1 FdtA/QdtA family cupin domain-containing protein [Nocardiopsis sp. EMB25]